ncbi:MULTISPECIES: hypothetical protein [unclassified Chitinophaga]|uniref:hypothetical protein n=1 Tax=unclassified Chitinophaga TaxID=2619133 RepID=UPI0009CB88E8|nr:MULTISPECIES: hypothetical protein [unclassified Chitinophaga]OMP75483.1 hypothetical protein BW716_29965 [[Flexibacter] sp. ATCC 35208]WPV65688.1 hypothetical protein QQL36_28190 [Chitinophaga sp. LS1]
MKNKWWLLLLIIACSAGSSSKDNSTQSGEGIIVDSIYGWQHNVLADGDSISYGKLALELSFKRMDRWALLYYAQVMCNKYKNASACLDCYEINNEVGCPEHLKTYDSSTYVLGTYYLLRAYELGNSEAEGYVKDRFGNNVPHSIDLKDGALWVK